MPQPDPARSAASVRCVVETEAEVTFTVRNADAIERVTGPGGDEWRSHFYALRTLEDVLEHWAYNVLINGVRDISRLEGWADLAITDVDIAIEQRRPRYRVLP